MSSWLYTSSIEIDFDTNMIFACVVDTQHMEISYLYQSTIQSKYSKMLLNNWTLPNGVYQGNYVNEVLVRKTKWVMIVVLCHQLRWMMAIATISRMTTISNSWY